MAVRTAFYRGSALLGSEGLYTHLPKAGDLRPYARNVEELIQRQLVGYKVWLGAMERSGIDWRLFFEIGGNALKASWNSVRLNGHGTVELRSVDGNYPEVVLAAAALVHGAANRVRSEGLKVTPDEEVRAFDVSENRLYVPGFEYLGKRLSYATATEGVESLEVSTYLDSVFEFAASDVPGQKYLAGLRLPGGFYRTTEDEILNENPLITHVSIEEGLHLVREACDELEEQVFRAISDQPPAVSKNTS